MQLQLDECIRIAQQTEAGAPICPLQSHGSCRSLKLFELIRQISILFVQNYRSSPRNNAERGGHSLIRSGWSSRALDGCTACSSGRRKGNASTKVLFKYIYFHRSLNETLRKCDYKLHISQVKPASQISDIPPFQSSNRDPSREGKYKCVFMTLQFQEVPIVLLSDDGQYVWHSGVALDVYVSYVPGGT